MRLTIHTIQQSDYDYLALCRAESDLISKSGVGSGTETEAVMQAVRSYFKHRENAERAAQPEPFIEAEVAIPPADWIGSGGSAEIRVLPDIWARMTRREQIEWAISNGQEVVVTYTSARTDETTTRRVRPLNFSGDGFMEKVLIQDVEADYAAKQFFVKGISLVEQVV